jgi:hypothetical protein
MVPVPGEADEAAARAPRQRYGFDWRPPDGAPLPLAALACIERLLDRLELVMTQIKGVENARDAVVARPAAETAKQGPVCGDRRARAAFQLVAERHASLSLEIRHSTAWNDSHTVRSRHSSNT